MTPYQFALLRYVHNVAAEEFVNIGVVMFLPAEKRLLFTVTDRYARLSNFFEGFNRANYRRMLSDLKSRLRTASKKNVSADIETINEILPNIVAIESGCFQWSETMGGVTSDAEERLQKLYAEFITRHESRHDRPRREEKEIANALIDRLRRHGIESRLEKDVSIKSSKYEYKFKLGWQNGTRQFMEPISFDYLEKESVIEKANKWVGRLYNLKDAESFQLTGIVAAPQQRRLANAFNQAVEILKDAPNVREIIREEKIEDFIPEIEKDLAENQS
jgi:hypothetical protein